MPSSLSRSLAAICLSSLLLPSVALAVPVQRQLTFPQLLTIIHQNKLPSSFTMNVNGSGEDYTVALSVTGTSNGRSDTIKNAAVDLSGTLNVTGPDGMAGNAAFDMRVVNGIFYVRLKSLKLTGLDGLIDQGQLQPYLNVWISTPLDDMTDAENQQNRDDAFQKLLSWAPFFSLSSIQQGKTLHTTITVPQNKKQRFLQKILNVSSSSSAAENASVRGALRVMSFDWTMTVDTVGSSLGGAGFTLGVQGKKQPYIGSLTLKMGMQTLSKQPVIQAPDTSKTLQEIESAIWNQESQP